MNCDKIVITTKGIRLEIDDPDLRFSIIHANYDSDGDMESNIYSVKELMNNGIEITEKCDLKMQTQWEDYRKELKKLQEHANKIFEENKLLTQKLKELMLTK